MWLTRRRRGENTNLSALLLSPGLRRGGVAASPLPAAARTHLYLPAPAAPGLAESRAATATRNRRFRQRESPPAIRAEHQPEVGGWTR